MPTEIRGQQPNKRRQYKQLPLGRLLVAMLVSFFVIVGITIGVLNVFNSRIIIATMLSIAFACLCIVFVLLQVFVPLPLPSTKVRPSSPRELAASNKVISRRISGLPSTNSRTIQQRQKAVEDLYMTLMKQDVSAIVLEGMVGVGKSTLAALVFDYTEMQGLEGKGPYATEALWININDDETMIDVAKTLFKALGKRLPNFESFTPNELALALFEALNIASKPRLVVLDQFDNLLDVRTGQVEADHPGVSEWIEILSRRRSSCRILFVTRFWPKIGFNYPESYIQQYQVKGLEIDKGAELLRKLEVKGTEEEWGAAIERCEGHPYALRILPTFLHDYCLSLNTWVKDPIFTKLWLKEVAHNLLERIFKQQLSQMQRWLLVAFSIYREPVPLDAAEYLMDFGAELPHANIQHTLDILLAQYLIEKVEASRDEALENEYKPHPIVVSYIQDHYYEGDEQPSQYTFERMHHKAAQYYQEHVSTPREQRRRMNDVHPLIEAFYQLCQAGYYQEAYELMEKEHISSDLERLEKKTILLELYQMLLPLDKWHPAPLQEVTIYNNIGRLYNESGQKKEALKSVGRALHTGDRWAEVKTLNHLGQIYDDLEQYEEALKYYEQALSILKEIGDHWEESRILHNMVRIYKILGRKTEAKKYSDQALSISREIEHHGGEVRTLNSSERRHDDHQKKKEHLERVLHISQREGDRKREVLTLRNLGRIYYDMGLKKEAHDSFVKAFHIHSEEGDRRGVASALQHIGLLYFEERHYEAALASLLLAKRIFEDVQSPDRDKAQKWIDILHKKVGQYRFEELLERVESQEHHIVEKALREGI